MVFTDLRNSPDVRPSDVRQVSDVRYFHHRTIQSHIYGFLGSPIVRAPDDRHVSDVRILCTDSWLIYSQRPDDRCLSDVRTYLCHRTSGVVRTSDLSCALKCPKRSLFHTYYIYTSPFHGIRLTIHFELAKNTLHSLSLNPLHQILDPQVI